MKRPAIIIAILLAAVTVKAQVSFKTLVSATSIVAGESFRIQYVLSDGAKVGNFVAPDFGAFRVAAGPDIYLSSGAASFQSPQVKNYVFTLVAPRTGKYTIPGAVINIDGKFIKSNAVLVDVVSKETAARMSGMDAPSSDFMLKPGDNVQEKIKENLFVKVSVNKKTCYVGEPVLATFKLYSRLESKSDITKNPGFYGFTVYDMVNLQDKIVETENINGRLFDVHTIRKVQLYPLQAGVFSIDAMQVLNKVAYSKNTVRKKAEQEISEGLLGSGEDELPDEGTTIYENIITTEPVAITVKAMPEKNKPVVFNGAVGRFSIAASLAKNILAKNEEGFLEITIKGKGNFIQLSAPAIAWPEGVEGFDPSVKDSLDKTSLPLAGSRTFRYPFVCNKPGTYSFQPVSFSFFDADSNAFKTITAGAMKVVIDNTEKTTIAAVAEKKTSIAVESERAARRAVIIVVSIVLLVLGYWAIKKKEQPVVPVEPIVKGPSAEELLTTLSAEMAEQGPIEFSQSLQNTIWTFLGQRFDISGSGMNKQLLKEKMRVAGVDVETSNQLFQLLSNCEAEIFAGVSLSQDKELVLQQAKEILQQIEQSAA
jgi:BatD DUF11 like domain